MLLAIAYGFGDLVTERQIQLMSPLILSLYLRIFGQQVVVFLHPAFSLDMGNGLHRFGAGKIAGRREGHSPRQQRSGHHSQWASARASSTDGDHASRVTTKLLVHRVNVLIGRRGGQYLHREGFGLFDDRHVLCHSYCAPDCDWSLFCVFADDSSCCPLLSVVPPFAAAFLSSA